MEYRSLKKPADDGNGDGTKSAYGPGTSTIRELIIVQVLFAEERITQILNRNRNKKDHIVTTVLYEEESRGQPDSTLTFVMCCFRWLRPCEYF